MGSKILWSSETFTSVVAQRMDYVALIGIGWWNMDDYNTSPFRNSNQQSVLHWKQFWDVSIPLPLEIEISIAPVPMCIYGYKVTSSVQSPAYKFRRKTTQSTNASNEPSLPKAVSPLQYIQRSFSAYMSTPMETIHPFARPPWREAKKRHDETARDPNTICIYKDGSGIDGQISAAA